MALIHVIIPVYNAAAHLGEAVHSVLNQPSREIDILLVDDGSTDGSASLCDAMARHEPRVTVLHRENGGVSAARNTGLDYVLSHRDTTGYIAFLDADDLWCPEVFTPAVMRELEESDADIVGFSMYCSNSDATWLQVFSRYESETLTFRRKYQTEFLWAKGSFAAHLYRVDLFRAHPVRFDPACRQNEDVIFSAKLLFCARKLSFSERFLYIYRRNPASATARTRYTPENAAHIPDAWAAAAKFAAGCPEADSEAKTHWQRFCESTAAIRCLEMLRLLAEGGYPSKEIHRAFSGRGYYEAIPALPPEALADWQRPDLIRYQKNRAGFYAHFRKIGLFKRLVRPLARLPFVRFLRDKDRYPIPRSTLTGQRKRILFLIHDLGPGGAEKVLVNLVNNMDRSRFDITLMTLFGGGVNEGFLKPHIRHHTVFRRTFPGNSHILKLFSPQALHRLLIRERYDIEVSYLEGPAARILSGCPHTDTKTVCWIHVEQGTRDCAAASFRSYREALRTYNAFDRIICVSEAVREDFRRLLPVSVPTQVLRNTYESEKILEAAREAVELGLFSPGEIRLTAVGKLRKNKGFHRLIPILRRLRKEGFPVRLYLLGDGPQREALEQLAAAEGVSGCVTLLGYQTNPYKYMANCDLFLCASLAEGFSTAAAEALILGIPVCTVEAAGMKELLGAENEYGLITENSDDALYHGINQLLSAPALLAHYREKATERGRMLRTENTVHAVEEMLLGLQEK